MKTETLAERTQGIWEAGYGENSMAYGIFTKKMLDEGLEESPICLISPIDKMNEQDKANAKFICKAANNYDGLLNALKLAVEYFEGENFPNEQQLNSMKEAIKNAKL